MKKKIRTSSKTAAAPVIAALIFAALLLFHFTGIFDYLEFKTYDFRVRIMAHYSRPSDDIIVVLVDQESINWAQENRRWSWPWPRAAYAEIIEYMNVSGAASVAFDIIFSEPSVYGSEDDAAFIKASEDYGRVVQTVVVSGLGTPWPGGLDKPLFSLDEEGRAAFLGADETGRGGQFPVEGLRDAAGVLGSVTNSPDSDSVIRRTSLFTPFNGRAVPGLAAALLLAAGRDKELSYDGKMNVFRWGDYTIPLDRNRQVLPHFRGDLDRYIPYSASAILRSAESLEKGETPLLLPEEFTGKYVFVGLNAQGLFDFFNTPVSSIYPGVGMHITVLDNLLEADFIRESPQWVNVLVILAAVVLTSLITLFSNRIPLTIGGVLLMIAAFSALAINVYYFFNLWIPMVASLAAVLGAFLTGTLYNYATEGSQKRFIKSAFSQYLSPVVIDRIIADPSQLKLGGETRELTAIFTDVRSFSTISEALKDPATNEPDPEKLVNLLNHYLTRMSDIILDNQGTIDKYEGDAIIAFFGAPLPMEDHAARACRSAILMKKKEAEINREVIALGLVNSDVQKALFNKKITQTIDDPAPLFTRLGLNTGKMTVGNMGTPKKTDYTIMGNAVNLAARLEGVNKQYNTGGILISEYTRAKIGDEFVLRSLSRVRVVGINTPLRLYELLDIRSEAPESLTGMTVIWERAFEAYEHRDFEKALELFGGIAEADKGDMVARLYGERCQNYLKTPPDDREWDDGVDNLTQK
ncbi:MAG: adenylate/guanylate cyclase domain-containing protein [Treponema sp.]|jgi:adenylate cyclase|nr:adenylate/guanylate cyclase domain-containing protein [Treponema sp.]